MKKNRTGVIWGIALILFGIFIAGRSVGLFSFSFFFRGWWTLFIIIPCFLGLVNNPKQNRNSNFIGLGVGILLLLASNRLFPWKLIFPLVCAGWFISMGLRFLKSDKNSGKESRTQYYTGEDWEQQTTSDPYGDQGYREEFQTGQQADTSWQQESYQNAQQESFQERQYRNTGYEGASQNNHSDGRFAGSAILSGKTVRFDNQLVTSGIFSCVLGGMVLDLRNAVIRDSAVIDVKVLMGGIDVLVPPDVRLVINCTPILGGVEDKTAPSSIGGFLPTIYINGTCVLGGVDVKYK